MPRHPGMVLVLALGCAAPAGSPVALANLVTAPTLTVQQSGTTQRLQAISPVNDQVVWVSGTGGTYVLTTDGGASWKSGAVPGADSLEFRDVQGISDQEAYLLSAGNGPASRIYHTSDGGRSWTRQFTNTDSLAFYDCFAFWGRNRGIAMSDGVKGVFPVLRTTDGRTWTNIGANLPPAAPGEGAFAASGTCVATQGTQLGWIATGAGPSSRVFATTDGGETWTAYATPIVQGGSSAGAFTIAFRDARHGFLGGGNLAATNAPSENVATSSDGGKTWTLGARSPFAGAIYGSSYVPGLRTMVVITGPAGAAWSADEGGSWTLFEEARDYWSVAFAGPRAGWLVGTGGRILKVTF
jgi:photosystem II stability/assembly factor-like uncharacterized protein